ncbi:sugar phosphate isomerase/epimerase family protein [Enterococcus sp. LJL98]
MTLLKGMNVWSLPAGLTIEEQFQLTKDAGFDTIELNLSEAQAAETIVSKDLALNDSPTLTTEVTAEELANIKALSEKYELPITSISTALHWSYPLTSEDEATRQKGLAVVKKMIDVCLALGGDTVLVVPGLVTPTDSYDVCYDRSLAAFKELAPYAEEKGIFIGIENVWNKFLLSPLETRDFIDKIASSHVGMYFDAGNVLQFGFPEQWVRILGARIKKIHVKDFNTTIGNITGFTSLLNGSLNWKALVAALHEIGYTGPLTCELSAYQENGQQLAYDTSRALDYIVNL